MAVDTRSLDSGHSSRLVQVYTNDPRRGALSLAVHVNVQPEFLVSANTIEFGYVPEDRESVRKLVLTIARAQIQLLEIRSTDPAVAATLEPPQASSQQRAVVVTRKVGVPRGRHSGLIVVSSTSSFMPELRIPVRGVVVPRDDAGPSGGVPDSSTEARMQ